MNRSDLIAVMATRLREIHRDDIAVSTKLILESISQVLARGGRVEIRGFGSFQLNYRPPRIARNPLSGEEVHVPAKYVPLFKAGKGLREIIDATRDIATADGKGT